MPRKPRLLLHDGWYHVMNRGAGRRPIFTKDKHCFYFLELLEETTELFNAKFHAYCLMSNHYHLLIKTPDANLDEIMKRINGLYTQKYNQYEQNDGPIFRGRYHAIVVEGLTYLQKVHRYIHLNPVEANLTQLPHAYLWSSCGAYLNYTEPPDWLCTEECLRYLGGQDSYHEFLKRGIDDKT